MAGLHAPLSTLRRTPHGMLRMTRVGVVRYTFTVMDLHHLLLTGLPAHYINFRFVRCPLDGIDQGHSYRLLVRILILGSGTRNLKVTSPIGLCRRPSVLMCDSVSFLLELVVD
jgi:hypothetical protein